MENFDDKTFSLVCGHQISTADGVVLREQQYQKTLKSKDEEDQSKKVEIFHKKSIGDSYYAVKMIVTDGNPGEKKVETNMNEDELKEFQEKWNDLSYSLLEDCDHDD